MRHLSFALRIAASAALLLCATSLLHARPSPLGTAFTYQGELTQSGTPLNATADFQFTLWDALGGGTQIGVLATADNVTLTDGRFTVPIDFGANAFNGDARWLEIAVRSPAGSGGFQTLTPRQPLTVAPYALQTRGIFVDSTNDVGIGTTSPLYPLHLQRADAVRLLYANNLNNDPGTTYAAYARVTGNDGIAVYGVHDSTSGIAPAILGESDSSSVNAIGVHGLIDTTSAGSLSAAVRGENRGTGTTGIGVFGSHDGGGWGVHGQTNGGLGRGVFGQSTVSNGVGGWFDCNGGVALLADGADNTGATAAVRIISGSQNMYLDGNEIDADAGLFLNNNNDQNVTIAGGGGDVVLGQSSFQDGFVVIHANVGTSVMTIGDTDAVVTITDQDTLLWKGLYVEEVAPNTVARLNLVGSDGTLVQFLNDGLSAGSISVAGAIVSYNAFTGSHYAWTDQALERGTLVVMTGDNRRRSKDPGAEPIYGVAHSTSPNDSRCLGAYLGILEPDQPATLENPHQIMAVGNGDMWVAESSTGDIQPGDYLISSDIAGCAMKDDPNRFPVGHVVARAGEAVHWADLESPADGTAKRRRISVFFESFERDSDTLELAALRTQHETELASLIDANAALTDRVAALEAAMQNLLAASEGTNQ